jgi:hypothetical protein
MNYLTYIEHSAENLQFFLWYRDYVKRFSEAKTADIGLAPVWTQAQHEAALQTVQIQSTTQKRMIKPESAAEIFQGTDFEKVPKVTGNGSMDPFVTPPRTPAEALSGNGSTHPWDSTRGLSEQGSLFNTTPSNAESYHQLAGEAFVAAGMKQPCMYNSLCILCCKCLLVLKSPSSLSVRRLTVSS